MTSQTERHGQMGSYCPRCGAAEHSDPAKPCRSIGMSGYLHKSDRELAEENGTDERDEADAALEEAERAAGR